MRAALPLAVLALTSGCAVPVASGLGESEANLVIVALDESGIPASKEVDPNKEGGFRVTVEQGDASAAVSVLTHQSLPTEGSPGVIDSLGQGSLVPSRTAEHAKLSAGIAGDLERSLRSVEGVVSVRVHLAVPLKDALAIASASVPPSASVLIRHRGSTPPIAAPDVQRLVAGAVPGLAADAVSVVATSVPAAPRPPDRELARFGPISVARGSLGSLRALVAGILLVNVALVALALRLWSRLRGQRAAAEAASE